MYLLVLDFGDFRGPVVWHFFTLGDFGDLQLAIEEGKQLGTCRSCCEKLLWGGLCDWGWMCIYLCNTFLMCSQTYGLLPQFLATQWCL